MFSRPANSGGKLQLCKAHAGRFDSCFKSSMIRGKSSSHSEMLCFLKEFFHIYESSGFLEKLFQSSNKECMCKHKQYACASIRIVHMHATSNKKINQFIKHCETTTTQILQKNRTYNAKTVFVFAMKSFKNLTTNCIRM